MTIDERAEKLHFKVCGCRRRDIHIQVIAAEIRAAVEEALCDENPEIEEYIDKAIAEEREACAKIAEREEMLKRGRLISDVIRARKDAK